MSTREPLITSNPEHDARVHALIGQPDSARFSSASHEGQHVSEFGYIEPNDAHSSRGVWQIQSGGTDELSTVKKLLGGSLASQDCLLAGGWLLFILAGYIVARLGCQIGLPYDGLTGTDPYETFSDISQMLQFGFLLGWFTRIMDIGRFKHLFCTSAWYFVPTFLGTPPVYGLISNIPAFRHSLADISQWGIAMWTLWLSATGAALISIGWHIREVASQQSQSEAIAYVASRCAVLGFYVGAGIFLHAMGSRYSQLHVHHLYLGWAIAAFAAFDHPISVVTLALGMGIFVQGIGAYSFASSWSDPSCFNTNVAKAVDCRFRAGADVKDFSLSICPGDAGGGNPVHQCFYRHPWRPNAL